MAGKQKVRVLHVITRFVVGGAAETVLLMATRLDRARFSFTVASGPSTGPEGSMEDQIPSHIAFERIPGLVRNPHLVKDVAAVSQLYALMRRGRYHIVHTHTTKAGLLGRVAARLARVPIVIHMPHGHPFHDFINHVGTETLKWVERRLAHWTHRIICLTEAERQDLLRFRFGPPGKFEIIHSGVDVERFRQASFTSGATRQALGLPNDGPLVGCVARLVPVKGVRFLLEALPLVRAAVPQATVVFVGDGPLRGELGRCARALGLQEAVVFLGIRRDVHEIMPLFDIVVLPSLNEGMGRVAVEALASGRPVIGARVDGLPHVISEGKTGFLVPPADPGALATAIIRCLANPAATRAMGQRARHDVDRYSIDSMITKVDNLYVQLLQATLGGRSDPICGGAIPRAHPE